jgi:uncharacterized protein YqgC (DUF456 family)
MLPILLLVAGALVSLPLTAVGLPGTWAFIAGACLWKSFDPAASVSWTALFVALGLALVAEALEWTLATRYAERYGGSRRAGWGALLGGIVGAVVGVPIPVVGSIVGSFAGAFLGALAAEYTVHGEHERAGRVAWGALLGRVIAAGAKVGIGVVVAVVVIVSAL